MENEAIVDFIQLTEWLQTRDQKNARIIANRSALRSLPTLESLVKLESQNFRDNLILPTFRACISFSMYFSGIKYSKARSAANAKIPKNPDTHFAISSVDHALMACFSMPSPLIYIAANAVQQSAISIYGYTNEINSPKNIDP